MKEFRFPVRKPIRRQRSEGLRAENQTTALLLVTHRREIQPYNPWDPVKIECQFDRGRGSE